MLKTHKPISVLAQDGQDLSIVAGLVQDSMFPVSDTKYDPEEKTFVAVVNRFCWESVEGKRLFSRTHSILHFSDVESVFSQNVDKGKDRIYNLLSMIPVQNGDAQNIFLTLAGGGVIRLAVGSIKLTLKDVGEPWQTASKPMHENTDLA